MPQLYRFECMRIELSGLAWSTSCSTRKFQAPEAWWSQPKLLSVSSYLSKSLGNISPHCNEVTEVSSHVTQEDSRKTRQYLPRSVREGVNRGADPFHRAHRRFCDLPALTSGVSSFHDIDNNTGTTEPGYTLQLVATRRTYLRYARVVFEYEKMVKCRLGQLKKALLRLCRVSTLVLWRC